MSKGGLAAEVTSELRGLVSGRVSIADGVVPPLVFVIANALFGIGWASTLGIGSALVIVTVRLVRGNPLRFAIAGLAGTLLASLLALRTGQASDFFLPGLITATAAAVGALASIPLKRPFVAWTSWLTRGWPLGWYWHDKVRPAYSKATWLWVAYLGGRALAQWWLFLTDQVTALGFVRVLLGWPGLLALLIATYVLGRRWLTALGGPSIEEWETGSEPPWEGQRVGF